MSLVTEAPDDELTFAVHDLGRERAAGTPAPRTSASSPRDPRLAVAGAAGRPRRRHAPVADRPRRRRSPTGS